MENIIVVIIIIAIIIYVYYNWFAVRTISPFENMNNIVKYQVNFSTNWGTDKNQINYPSDPHTGNMFLITHNNNFKLFQLGQQASLGISNTSMFGTIDDLMNLIKNNSNVKYLSTGKVLMAPGQQSLLINADKNNHYLSFVTMVAPSPDWFTGISNVNLIANNKWVEQLNIPLYVYDAGTDKGSGFNTEHYPENINYPITLKNDNFIYPDGQIKPIAFINIRKI